MDKKPYVSFDVFGYYHFTFNICLIGFAIGLIFVLLTGTTETEQSRLVQQCEVTGRSLNCQQNTSWYEENHCSCSVSNERRITYLLDPE